MRIVHFLNSVDRVGGAEILALNLAIEQKKAGHMPALVALRGLEPTNPMGLEMLKRAAAAEVPILYLRKPHDSGFKHVGTCAANLRAYLDTESADIVHSHGELPDLITAYISTRAAKLRTIHTTRAWPQFPFLLSYLFEWLIRWRLGMHVYVSEDVQMYYRSSYGYGPASGIVIPNGVSVDEDFLMLKAQASRPYTFALVGRQTLVKGHQDYLEAIKLVCDAGTSVGTFYILGPDGDATVGIHETIQRLNIGHKVVVQNKLNQHDLHAFIYENIDCLVAPSTTEGLNLGVLEGMTMGKPCIAYKNGGLATIVNEYTGIALETKNAASLAKAMILAAKEHKVGTATTTTIKQFVQAYGMSKCAHTYQHLYSKALGLKPKV